MEEVVASVFDLMGKTADPQLEEQLINQRVDTMFQVTQLHFLQSLINLLLAISYLCSGYILREAIVISFVLPFVYHGFTHITVHLRIYSFFSMRIL